MLMPRPPHLIALFASCCVALACDSSRDIPAELPQPSLVSTAEPRPVLPFSGRMGVLLSPDTLVMLDRESPGVVLVDMVRSTTHRIGGEGAGPAEFSLPIEVDRTSDGGLVVADGRQMRLSWWRASGELLRTAPLPAWPLRIWALSPDSLLAVWLPFTPGAGPRIGYFLPPDPTPRGERSLSRIIPAFANAERPAFPTVGRCPDGSVIVGHAASYQLTRLHSDGTVRSFGRSDLEPVLFTKAEIEDRERRLRRIVGEGPEGASQELEKLMRERRNEPKPFFTSAIAVDEEGTIWLPTTRGGPDSTTVDVFDCGGSFHGELTLRDQIRNLIVSEGRLIAHVKRTAAQYFDQEGIDVYDVSRVLD